MMKKFVRCKNFRCLFSYGISSYILFLYFFPLLSTKTPYLSDAYCNKKSEGAAVLRTPLLFRYGDQLARAMCKCSQICVRLGTPKKLAFSAGVFLTSGRYLGFSKQRKVGER